MNKEKKVNEKSKDNKKTSLGGKIVLRIVTSLVISLIILGSIYFFGKDFFKQKKESSHAMIEKQLSFCQELITAKYRYSDIITLKKSSGFAKSYSIIKYSGVIKCGIGELTDIDFTVNELNKTVYMSLPLSQMLGNEITKLEVFDEKQSIFVPITTQEIFDEIENAKNETAEDLISEGILKDSNEYAKRIITQFMYSLGFENVVFENKIKN